MSTLTNQSDIKALIKFNFEQKTGKLMDLTGNDIVGTASHCTTVDDQFMGTCMQFDGTDSKITFPSTVMASDNAFQIGLTIACWAKFEDLDSTTNTLLHCSNKSGGGIVLYTTDDMLYYWCNNTIFSCKETLAPGQWYHLAIAVDALGKAQFFVNGQASTSTTESGLVPPNMEGSQNITQYIGCGPGEQGWNFLDGTLAWISIYNGPLGQADILGDMAEGQSNRPTSFRQSMPIDFKLYSDDGGAENPIMFIEDEGAGENLNLRIVNNSTKSITINKNNDPVSSTNYHFQLHFRPGVLSNNFLLKYAPNAEKTTSASGSSSKTKIPELLAHNPNWTAVVNENSSGTDTISFLYKGSSSLTIDKGKEHLIVVSAVNASATGGSRNTNVELRYASIFLGAATEAITGHRKQNVSIVNHSGDKDIPLRAEIVGNASVMTYAQSATGEKISNPPTTDLVFRIVNIGNKPLNLNLPIDKDGASKFTLSFDVQPTGYLTEWALIAQGDINDGLNLVLDKIGIVQSYDGERGVITLKAPLTESLDKNTALMISSESGPVKVTVSGAEAGAYHISLIEKPSNSTQIKLGADIELAQQESVWKPNQENPSLKQIGTILSYDHNVTITLETALQEALAANTPVIISNGSESLHALSTEAAEGATQILLTEKPAQGVSIIAGDTIQLYTQSENSTSSEKNGLNAGKVSQGSKMNTGLVTKAQWTVTNQKVKALEPGGGITFLLKGIQCSLSSGASNISIGYQNIPGHWDGSFLLEVKRSPIALYENLVGINTLAPQASLHIQAEQSSIPLKIQKEEAIGKLNLNHSLNYLARRLRTLDLNKQIYYDEDVYHDSNKKTYYWNIWELGNPIPLINQIELSNPDTNVFGPSIEKTHWSPFKCIYHQGYLYVQSDPYIASYRVNTDSAYGLTFLNVKEFSEDQNNNSSYVTNFSNLNVVNGYIYYSTEFCVGAIKGLGTATSEPNLRPVTYPQLALPDMTNGSGDNFTICYANDYLIIGNRYAALTYDSQDDGTLSKLGKFQMNIPEGAKDHDYSFSQMHMIGDYAFFWVYPNYLITYDMSDPASPSQIGSVFELPMNHEQKSQVNEYQYIVKDEFFFFPINNQLSIYSFSIQNGFQLFKTLDLGDSFALYGIKQLGSKILLTQKQPGTNEGETYVLEEESFFEYTLGGGLNLYADGIGFGSLRPKSSALAMPYPATSKKGAIIIGDPIISGVAALAISTAKESVVDPISIKDESGSPVFNIKQPPGQGQPYRVGIGTDNPKVPLHVSTSTLWKNYVTGSSTALPFNYVNGKSGVDVNRWTKNNNGQWPVSLVTDQGIVCQQIFVLSDARIKDLAASANQAQDLNSLLGLKVADYQYIDFVGKGASRKKGLIAQQVKEVFPQAVSAENSDFIPDIYAMATDLGWQPITKHLRVSLEHRHELAKGDKVRVLVDKGFEEKEVVDVPNEKSFVVSDWDKPVDKLFVFGKEVHDFHTVDYDQVAMLGVSAIQALNEKVETHQERIEHLAQENEMLRKELEDFKEEFRAFQRKYKKEPEIN